MESVPEDGGEAHEHDHREDEVVDELSDKGGNVGAGDVRRLAVGIFAECLADGPVEGVVDQTGGEERDGTAEQDEPRAAEDAVKYGVVPGVGGNDAGNEEDEAGQKVDGGRQQGDAVGGLRAKVLGDHVHAHKG